MARVAPKLSYCVVNTEGREFLLACLDAIERTHPAGVEREILVLDNASGDGSADAVRARGGEIRLIALEQRTGKGANDSTLMREAKGEYCLLLNEDSELRPGAAAALLEAMEADPSGGRRGGAAARLRGPARPLRLEIPRGRDRRRRRPLPAQAADRAEPRRSDQSRRLGAVERAAGPARGGGVGRLHGPRVLRLLRRVRLLPPPCRGRPPHALRARRRGGPPRPALDRPRGGTPPDRRIPPQPRPLHAQARLPPRRPRGAGADRLVLRGPRRRRRVRPRPARPRLLGPRPPGAVPEPRRVAPRSGSVS